MNERIEKLITQAGGYWNYGDFNMPSSVEFQEQDIEKFAELIVRECICQCDDENSQKYIMSHFRSLLPIGFTEKDWS